MTSKFKYGISRGCGRYYFRLLDLITLYPIKTLSNLEWLVLKNLEHFRFNLLLYISYFKLTSIIFDFCYCLYSQQINVDDSEACEACNFLVFNRWNSWNLMKRMKKPIGNIIFLFKCRKNQVFLFNSMLFALLRPMVVCTIKEKQTLFKRQV